MSLGCYKLLSDWIMIAFSSLNPYEEKKERNINFVCKTLITVTFIFCCCRGVWSVGVRNGDGVPKGGYNSSVTILLIFFLASKHG